LILHDSIKNVNSLLEILRQMKKYILSLIVPFVLNSVAFGQCPVENTFTYGSNGEAEFSHTYYEIETGSVFAVGYFEDQITLGDSVYTTPNAGETGKYIAKLDTLGNLLNSWQILAEGNIVGGGASQKGYFEPGMFVTSSEIFIPTTYLDASGNFTYSVESYDLNGIRNWRKDFQGGPNEYGNLGFDAIDMDGLGNLILTGVLADQVSYQETVTEFIGTDGRSTAFVMSLNAIDGSLDVFVPIESAGNMELFGLETGENGSVFVSGNSLGATSVSIDGVPTTFTGNNSAFIFSMSFEYETFTATLDWVKTFNSDTGIEIPALKYEFDINGSRLHYAATDYPDDSVDSLAVDTRVGVLNVFDGSVFWEHAMAVPNWYYLAYSSWLDPNQQFIYYPVWIKSGSQFESELYMDGALLEDSISSLTVVQKFNTVDGTSELISPTLFSFIGDVATLNSGTVIAQSNYTSAGEDVTVGVLNPSSYPFFYGYINNGGATNSIIDAVLEASTSSNAGPVTYQWYKDGEVVAGATDSTYVPIDSGFYAVEISNSVGCNFRTKSIKITEPEASYYDSLALVNFYQATNVNDTSWTVTDNWLSGPLESWYGVGVNAEGRVVTLDLSNNNLYGTIPPAIQDLTALNRLYLYSNNLGGEIPAEIGNLIDLQELVLHTNPLTGTIPPSIGNLTNLVDLRLSYTDLSGSIPNEIGNLTNLQILYLGFSQFNGTLPSTLGNLSNLVQLDLQNNQFEGSVPAELGNMSSLESFVAFGNLLSGELPQSLENLTSLISIDISNNNFSGVLPDLIHLPSIERIYVYRNPQLITSIPEDLDQLTQLRSYHIDGTVPIGGELPQIIFDATFMESYGLSGMNFTGSLTEANVSNLPNLIALYIAGNQLTGDIPQAFADLANLTNLDISYNFFSSLPDFNGNQSLISLNVQGNQFQISQLVANAQAGLEEFIYAPQKRIGENQSLAPAAGSDLTLTSAIEDFSGSTYQWIFNNDTLAGANSATYDLSNFNSLKAGAYVLQAAHPELPDLVVNSAFLNVKANINASRFYVDNNSAHTADFRDIYQAVSATKSGDTLYVAGSDINYEQAAIFSPRTIIGPGYFLEENTNTQFNKLSAKAPFFNITKDASGTKIYGMEVETVFLNNQSSSLPDTLKNVVLEGNKVQVLTLGDKNQNITFAKNFIKRLQINSTSVLGVNRSYDDIAVFNNIIDSVKTLFAEINAAENGLNNFNFDYNTIGYVSDSINDVAFNNNIIDVNLSANFTGSGNITFADANFTNGSGNLSIDNDFVPQTTNLDKGAFAGSDAYILSGLPPVPHIYDVIIGSRLSATVNAANNNGNNIERLRYLFRQNNSNTTAFNASGFTAETNISVQFLPNKTELVANQNYELVLVAIDETGKRSHRTYVPYTAIAANLSGSVIDINSTEVNSGLVRLFEVNPYANKYDTAGVQQLNGSNNFNFENLILGDYIILADPDTENYPDLLPTYLGNTIDWSLATTLQLESDTSNILIEVEKTPEENTEPGSEISGVMYEEYDEADSSLRKRPRLRVSGSSVTIRTRSGSTRGASSSLRLINDGDIVAYTKTDENGEFVVPNLPAGDYRIQCDYPGVPVDETSDIFFSVSGKAEEKITVEAVVEDGKIVVTETGRVTGIKGSKATTFKFYPNPAESVINLQLKNSNTKHMVKILSFNGVTVKQFTLSEGEHSFDVNDLHSGIYFIQLEDEAGNYFISRMMKE